MIVDRHSSEASENLHAQCVAIARRLSPDQADAWLESAQPFIRDTADAIRRIVSSLVSPLSEPAFRFEIAPEGVVDEQPALSNATDPIRASLGSQGDFTVLEAAQAIRQGDISPVELVEASLARIAATEGRVKAWDALTLESAIARAKEAERALQNGDDLGPLHGIPFGIKDNIFTEGIPTRGGSRLYETFIPSYDAHVVTLLKRAGAIVLGKTTTAEMALGDPPATRNPWNLAHTPGGSSTGSAAAVAARHVPFTIGTQTGGSLNRPAGYTGLVVLKPTFGRIDRHGIFPVSWTLDHVGFMTITAADQVVILRTLGLLPSSTGLTPAKGAASALDNLRGMVVGRPDRYFEESPHPAQREAYDRLLRFLENDLGVTVKEIVLPRSFEAAVAAHTIIMQCEAAAANADSLRERGHLIGPSLRSRLLCGSATGAAEYIRAQQVRNVYIHELSTLFQDAGIDVLATPTSPTPAPEGIHSTGSSMFNSPFSIAGFPTIVFPMGIEETTGLPLSAQFVAPPLQEETLLHLAMVYQNVTDWHTRLPTIVEESHPGSRG